MSLEYMNATKIMQKDALIVVDIQNDFLEGGSLAVPNGNDIIDGVNKLGRNFKDHGNRVIFTQDWHTTNHWSFAISHDGYEPFDPIEGIEGIGPVLWPVHCVQGTNGAEFHMDLDVNMAHLIIRKGFRTEIDSYSAIKENDHQTETGLAGYLTNAGIERIFVVGLAKDYCVNFTAADAKLKGFEVVVVDDLTRGIAEETIQSCENSLSSMGVKFIKSDQIQF
jgi:nicotinamidase/pyrazinamidase